MDIVQATDAALLTSADTATAEALRVLAMATQALADSLGALGRIPSSTGWQLADYLAVIGGGVGAASFLFGLWQYSRAQQLERAKFAAAAMERFFADPLVRNATSILDWKGREIPLWPDEGVDPPRTAYVDQDNAILALRTSNMSFTDAEVAIRDTFDYLFGQFIRFERLLRSRLVAEYDLRPFVSYWCNALKGRTGFNAELAAAAETFMRYYGLNDALRFIDRFADEPDVRAGV